MWLMAMGGLQTRKNKLYWQNEKNFGQPAEIANTSVNNLRLYSYLYDSKYLTLRKSIISDLLSRKQMSDVRMILFSWYNTSS